MGKYYEENEDGIIIILPTEEAKLNNTDEAKEELEKIKEELDIITQSIEVSNNNLVNEQSTNQRLEAKKVIIEEKIVELESLVNKK